VAIKSDFDHAASKQTQFMNEIKRKMAKYKADKPCIKPKENEGIPLAAFQPTNLVYLHKNSIFFKLIILIWQISQPSPERLPSSIFLLRCCRG